MRRRDFLLNSFLVANAILGRDPASAQQTPSKLARIAWVSVLPLAQVGSYLDAFRSGLAAEGYVEGRDVEVLARSADGNRDRLSAVVDEIVRLKPDVIVTQGAAIFSVRKVTDVPVVYGFSGDPVAAELTSSMARPSQNLTGVSFMAVEMNAKRLDLLRTAIPDAKKVVLMGDPIHPGVDREIAASQEMARQLGIDLRWVPTHSVQEVSDLLAGSPRIRQMPSLSCRMVSCWRAKSRLPSLHRSTGSLRSRAGAPSRIAAGFLPTGLACPRASSGSPTMSLASSEGLSLLIFLSRARPGSSW